MWSFPKNQLHINATPPLKKNTSLFNGKQPFRWLCWAIYSLWPTSLLSAKTYKHFQRHIRACGKAEWKIEVGCYGKLALRWALISLSNCFLSVIEETRVNRSGSRGVWNKSRRRSVLFGSNAFRVKCMYLNTFTVWILIAAHLDSE